MATNPTTTIEPKVWVRDIEIDQGPGGAAGWDIELCRSPTIPEGKGWRTATDEEASLGYHAGAISWK
jgi:hypothetical protein